MKPPSGFGGLSSVASGGVVLAPAGEARGDTDAPNAGIRLAGEARASSAFSALWLRCQYTLSYQLDLQAVV